MAGAAAMQLFGRIVPPMTPQQTAIWLPLNDFITPGYLVLVPYVRPVLAIFIGFLVIRRISLSWRQSSWVAPASVAGFTYLITLCAAGSYLLSRSLLLLSLILDDVGFGWGYAFVSLIAVYTVPVAFLLTELRSLLESKVP